MRAKCKKYALLMMTLNLCLEIYIQVKREKLLMNCSLDNDLIYANLTDQEMKRISRLRESKQIRLFGTGEESEVGQQTPFAIMRKDKMEEVDQCNKEVDIMLRKALEKMAKMA